jgi:hypothetical protein
MSGSQLSRKETQRGWQGGLKEPDEVNEVARHHRSDESGKRDLTLPKSLETGGGRSQAFELIMIIQSAFCGRHTLIQLWSPVHFTFQNFMEFSES